VQGAALYAGLQHVSLELLNNQLEQRGQKRGYWREGESHYHRGHGPEQGPEVGTTAVSDTQVPSSRA
jgi:hypothetical protein